MPHKATSISVKQLSNAAHAAAKSALTAAQLPHVEVEPGVVVDVHWIIGIILRNAEAAQLAQYHKVATEIVGKLQEIKSAIPTPLEKTELNPQPLPPGHVASVYLYDHIVICGYRPVPDAPLTFAE
jgi:hypothetical protein